VTNRRRRDHRARTWFLAGFLAPACLVYAAFVLYPLVQAVVLSTYRWRGLSPHGTFVGTGNFERLFADAAFWKALSNNLALLAGGGLLTIVLALLVAHAMTGRGRIAGVLRSVFLFPQVVSVVVVAVLWQFIFNPHGLLNSGLEAAGLQVLTRTWLGDPSWALPAVGVAFVWYAAGFYVLLFVAGLQSIPQETKEAAELDGALGWKRFVTITWPLLWAVKRVAVVYLAITVMNVFALPFLMTRGGPDRASESILTYLYEQAFVNSQFGYAAAVAVGNFVVVMAISLFLLFYFRRDPTEGRR
jgi:N-acetylglucosamine transport system permease protein